MYMKIWKGLWGSEEVIQVLWAFYQLSYINSFILLMLCFLFTPSAFYLIHTQKRKDFMS